MARNIGAIWQRGKSSSGYIEQGGTRYTFTMQATSDGFVFAGTVTGTVIDIGVGWSGELVIAGQARRYLITANPTYAPGGNRPRYIVQLETERSLQEAHERAALDAIEDQYEPTPRPF